MREALTTTTEVIGAAAICFGVALVSVPAAFIVGGVLAILGSYLAAQR
jgi:hypothetical protein